MPQQIEFEKYGSKQSKNTHNLCRCFSTCQRSSQEHEGENFDAKQNRVKNMVF